MDLADGKVLFEYSADGIIGKAVMSSDGKYVYVSEGGKNMYRLDTATGEKTEPDDDSYRIVAGNYNKVCIDISASGKYVAVSCSDGYVRVLDTETMKTCAEIPFKSYLKAFIAFTDDESHIVMQGDDYRIRIWDIASGAFANTTNATARI